MSPAGGAVLVTGAAGFIGSHVVDHLLARGDTVVGLDNFDPFYDPALKRENLAAALAAPGFTLVEGDLRDRALVDRVLAEHRVDAVIHLAARAGVRPSLADPELYADVNVRGSAVVFEAARAAGITRVIYASSSSVYGGNEKLPFAEDDPVDHPVSPYAATKKANELQAHVYSRLHGMTMIGLRFFTVYGPRQRPEMAIASFTRRIAEGRPVPMYGDGTSRRDYTYIDDIVAGVLAALDRGEGYRIYNLGESRTTSLARLIELIGEALGVTPQIERLPEQPGDVPATWADIRRARDELGYDPQVPVEDGIRRYVAWFRGRGEAGR
ncbi:MAG: NAD-dependent epimerase/dehydratase family protein [Acidobacteria bacterium]|nr:MAG: NAD-dependent epimerase/dehydratase family protein [Acidobacteriota bacterium]